MKNVASDFRTNLAKVRGLGSAKHGVGHWWFQRVTAIALIPTTLWFISQIIAVMLSADVTTVAEWFSSPINALLLSLMIAALFFHAKLGLQVVIEDYVRCPYSKYALLLGNVFFCFAGAALCIVATLKLHFLDIIAGSL